MKNKEIKSFIQDEIRKVAKLIKENDSFRLEPKLNERMIRGLKPLLMIGSIIKKTVGEAKLVALSDKFDELGDEQADDVASHLNMAIELMQDGYPGDATKMLKQFNKKCKEVLKGKSVGSVFEGKVTEGVSPKKASEILFDKLAATKLIGKQNRKRAVGVMEYMLSRMNFNESVN